MELRLPETIRRDFRARRQRGKLQQASCDAALDFERARSCDAFQREGWIWRQARLHHRGFGEPERVVRRLKLPVIEKRDLHRAIRRERLGAGVP